MDENIQAGTEGFIYGVGKGLGIVIMEPLRGGLLTRESTEIKKAWISSGSPALRQNGACAGSGINQRLPSFRLA
jgi:predicted aldo/keto reductase-like oxidoreductase